MKLDLSSLRVVKGQKSGIKPKVFEGALDNVIAKEAESTVNVSGVKYSGRFRCTKIEIRGGLLLWAHMAPSFKPSHKEVAQ
jgi:hypothetical protein